MKICIIGQGYIGLPTAALFTRNHCEVVGVDINKEIVNKLNQGITHIEEPGISEIIKNAVENKIYMASLTRFSKGCPPEKNFEQRENRPKSVMKYQEIAKEDRDGPAAEERREENTGNLMENFPENRGLQ